MRTLRLVLRWGAVLFLGYLAFSLGVTGLVWLAGQPLAALLPLALSGGAGWLCAREFRAIRRIERGLEEPSGPEAASWLVFGLVGGGLTLYLLACLPYFLRPYRALRAMEAAIDAKVPGAAEPKKLDAAGRRRSAAALAAALSDADLQVRRGACWRLRPLAAFPDAGVAEQALPALEAALKDPDRRVVGYCADALGALGAAAAPAVPALSAALGSEQQVPSSVAQALASAGPDGKAALIEALSSGDFWVGAAAASALGDLGPSASDALPALESALARPGSDRVGLQLAIDRIEGRRPR